MNGIFVTSTGTEIGKTFISAAYTYQRRMADLPIRTLKPIISGIEDGAMAGTDTAILAESLGLPLSEAVVNSISPFRFKAPLAPSMAAKLEGKKLDIGALLHFCRTTLEAEKFTLIEGVGGSFVPLDGPYLVANWIKDLGLSSLLVAGSYLGTISHTIATAEAMANRSIPVHKIIVSESAGEGHPDLLETTAEIMRLTGIETVPVPRQSGHNGWKNLPSLLD